jgi:hypothetical protein
MEKKREIYTTKTQKVKRKREEILADSLIFRYINRMQYKIPVQIENEDVIVAGLSLRQLAIMMA